MILNAKDNNLDFLEIKGVKIPLILEKNNLIPAYGINLVFVGGGNIFNQKYISGDGNKPISNVASKMLNYGTKKDGNLKFASLLESKAIDLNVSSTRVSLTFNMSSLNEFREFAFKQIGNLLKDPNITSKTLKEVKTIMNSAFLSETTNFDMQANNGLNKLVFKDTPLEYNPAGDSIESINSVSLSEIKKYLKDNLVLSRLVIVVGGDISKEDIIKNLAPILNTLSVGTKVEIPKIYLKPSKSKSTKKETEQSYIYFASPFNLDNLYEDYHKAIISGFILGSSGFGSRILEEVRVKRGLAYSAYLRPNVNKFSSYMIGHIQTGLDSEDETIKITKQVLNDFVKNGVTEEELNKAKAYLIGNEPLREEKLEDRLYAKFSNYINGLPLDYSKQFISKIKNLTLDELNSFIKSHDEITKLTFFVVNNGKTLNIENELNDFKLNANISLNGSESKEDKTDSCCKCGAKKHTDDHGHDHDHDSQCSH